MKKPTTKTGIAGFDALLYGGLYTKEKDEEHRGIVTLARGEHGVNKIHLAMQICEGLLRNYKKNNNAENAKEEFNTKLQECGKKLQECGGKLQECGEKLKGCGEKLQECGGKLQECGEELEKRQYRWMLETCENALSECMKELGKNFFSGCEDSLKDCEQSLSSCDEFLSACRSLLNKNRGKILFISLNKDTSMLKRLYYGFYIQRLLQGIKMGEKYDEEMSNLEDYCIYKGVIDNKKKIVKGGKVIIKGEVKLENPSFEELVKLEVIEYDFLTHALTIGEGSEKSVWCKLEDFCDDRIEIKGKDTLNGGNNMADGLTTFLSMMKELDENQYKNVEYIMIDGLSRLSEQELTQCPLNTLSAKLRDKSRFAIITADKKLLPSQINTDIVVDMEIRQTENPEYQYNALRITKCLYQKHVYGWHNYKMRYTGIEVIPSINVQMTQRDYTQDIMSEIFLPIGEILKNNEQQGKLYGKTFDNGESSNINECLNEIINTADDKKHILFVSFDKGKDKFFSELLASDGKKQEGNKKDFLHFFAFAPGVIPADEMLWTLDQQIRAIERKFWNQNDNDLDYYSNVSLVLCDINYIHYAYPLLSAESMLLSALSVFTKKHKMTNYVYATRNRGNDNESTELDKKELETFKMINTICDEWS